VKSTPLSGQPDVFGGTNPQVDSILQASIEHGYAEFIGRVAAARKLTPERVNEIGQGRVWDGGTARQIGLVDRFGTMDDAVAEAAKRAGIDPKNVRRVYLEKQPGWFAQLLAGLSNKDDDDSADTAGSGGDLFARYAAQRQEVFAQALGDAKRLATGASIQARCLECSSYGGGMTNSDDRTLARTLIQAIWK
jgi:protease-4